MSTIWQHDPEFADPGELTGYSVEAMDGSIGSVDEATWDTEADHIVVDTGKWIFGRKVLIPAGMIELIDLENQSVHLGLTREQIKNGPEYDESRHAAGGLGADFWSPYDDYYGQYPGGAAMP